MAMRLSHYIAPDICDEVEHSVHSLERNMKKTLTTCIERSIKSAFTEHAASLVANDCDSSATENKSGKQGTFQ